MDATLLGTSSAWPIPRPGCLCPQCAEARADRRLARTRSALRIEAGGEVVLVDASADLAGQLERDGRPPRVDRLLVTHTHADHILGLDDLVHLRTPAEPPLIVHAAPFHRDAIARIFPHLLRPKEARIRWGAWQDGTRLELGGVVLEGFETGHRETFPTTALILHVEEGGRGLRIAYATDMGAMPASSRERLRGVDRLVGDGTFLGAAGHGHPGTRAVLALAERLAIPRVAFTHVGHLGLDDAEVRARLGPGVGLLRDGDALES